MISDFQPNTAEVWLMMLMPIAEANLLSASTYIHPEGRRND